MTKATLPAPPDEVRSIVYYSDGNLYRTKSGKLIGENVKAATYKKVVINGRNYSVHRLTYWLCTGEWPDVVDHIDGNTYNNDISNLRAGTPTTNRINNRSKNGGVEKVGNKWVSRCRIKETNYYLGAFDDRKTALYAGFLFRDLLYPGVPPVPGELKGVIDEASRRI